MYTRNVDDVYVGQNAQIVHIHGGGVDNSITQTTVIALTKTLIKTAHGNFSRTYGWDPGSKIRGMGHTRYLQVEIVHVS